MAEKEQQSEPLFRDALFRQKRKHGKYRVVEAPALEYPVSDTHAHLQLLPDPVLALARCAIHGVRFVCTIVDVHEDGQETFENLVDWRSAAADEARRLPADLCWTAPRLQVPHVRIAVGCHPHNAEHYGDDLEALLRRRLTDPRVAAVGEIGLDYHYNFSTPDEQRMAFRRQVRLAKEAGLPVILHVREAHEEAFSLMQEEGFPEAGTLLHCFNLDWNTLEPWVDAGCFVAFGGPLTFKNADEVRDAAARAPLGRLVTETDAPYMTPEPMRGMTCGPEHVIFTAACLAEVRGCAPGIGREELLRTLMDNAHALLDREPTPWQRSERLAGSADAFQEGK